MTLNLYTPLKLFVCYILVTLLISFFGPMNYLEYDRLLVGLYMAAFCILFCIGYYLGVHRQVLVRKNGRVLGPYFLERQLIRILIVFIVLSFVIQLAVLAQFIAENGLVLRTPGSAYTMAYTGYERNIGRSYSLFEIVVILCDFPRLVAIVLGLTYYGKIPKVAKFCLIMTIALVLTRTFVLGGKQKYLGDIAILIASVLLTRIRTRRQKRRVSRAIVLAMALVALILVYSLSTRAAYRGITAYSYNQVAQSRVKIDLDHPLFDLLGYELGFPVATLLSGYLGGGYYGLSLCLALPFKWTYGLGSSYALGVLANRFLGLPWFLEDSYMVRMQMETGWPALSKWHTIFPWLASDVTFIGALVIMFFVAYFYGVVWVEATRFRNPISLLVFSLLNILLAFIPANNQLLHSPESFLSVMLVCLSWLKYHKYFNQSNQEG